MTEEPPVDKDRDQLYRYAERDLADGERPLAAFPFAAVPKLPKRAPDMPKQKVSTGIRQSTKRYRPVVCTNRRVLVYDTNRTPHARQLLAEFPATEVYAVDVLPGRWGGKVIVLALPGIGEVPFELGTKDLTDLATMLESLGRGA